MHKYLLLLSLLITTLHSGYSSICNSNGNGNWNATASWSCGRIPIAGDTIKIQIGHTITVTSTFTLSGAAVVLLIQGTLAFNNGREITLPINSRIELTGSILGGGGGGNSSNITIGNTVVWKSGDGNIAGPKLLTAPSCIAPSGCPLPLTLISFTIKKLSEQEVEITWATSDEYNIEYLTLQRSSDAVHWENLVNISSQNNKSYNAYRFIDIEPLNGNSYYRLKETDINGLVTYYEIKSLFVKNNTIEISIVPNPAVSAHFEIHSTMETEVSIYDLIGKVIHTQKVEIGKNAIHMKAIAGAYVMKARTIDGEKVLKLIIE